MMLFAQDPGGGTLIGLGFAALAGLGAFGSVLFGYLAKRDQQRFDSRMLMMEREIVDLKARIVVAENHLENAVAALTKSQEKSERAGVEAAKLQGELLGANREILELRQQTIDLRDRLHPKRKAP